MIKFFRKIRQRLLSENKFSKYLIYAIGEIVLVVIGILIALALNKQSNIKENNKLRDLYITQLNDEVDRNIDALNYHVDWSNNILREIDSLRNIVINKDYDNPKLLSKSHALYVSYHFKPNMVTYENLKFSGDLKLFNDLKIRNSISNAYHSFNKIKGVEEIDREAKNGFFAEYFLPYSKLIDMSKSSQNFGKDVIFENMVITRTTLLSQNIREYVNSIEALKELKTTFAEFQHDN
ncbi:MAG: hypothetical protein KJO96_05135 [Winogradskyella sp.]|nr:hypothetical protein [Winogradskyella sp.]MBT8393463.1 hypothetical protein [Bacteroidia bacterium]